MKTVTFSAPAKINLSLRVLGKRDDGYHEIETLMAPISLADEGEISLAPSHADRITFTCNDPSLPLGENNLCVKAACAFQEATALHDPVAITLLKRIPHGAGLGGGSSDAASVLMTMNQLFDEPLVIEELHQLAALLGSDVPFFLQKKLAWCRGRGEVIEETTEPLPQWSFLLIKPPFPVSTAWAFSQFQKANKESWKEEKTSVIDGITLFNDLEEPVFSKYLLLPVLKQWLQARPEVTTSWMSGSGSTMIALLKKENTSDQTTALKKEIASAFGETFWVKEASFRVGCPIKERQ